MYNSLIKIVYSAEYNGGYDGGGYSDYSQPPPSTAYPGTYGNNATGSNVSYGGQGGLGSGGGSGGNSSWSQSRNSGGGGYGGGNGENS